MEVQKTTTKSIVDQIVGEISLELFLSAARSRWQAFLLTFLVVLLIGGIYLSLKKPVYESVATIEIGLSEEKVLGDVKGVTSLGTDSWYKVSSYLKTQYAIISSRDILERVIEREHLDSDLAFLGLDGVEDQEKLKEILENLNVVDILAANLSVFPVLDTNLVKIRYRHTNPETAARIVNAITDIYLERNLIRRQASTTDAIGWLEKQLVELKEKLNHSAEELFDFKRENEILNTAIESNISVNATRIQRLMDEVTDQKAHVARLEAKVAKFDNLDDNDFLQSMISELSENVEIRNTRNELLKLQMEYARLSERYTDEHPDMVAMLNGIEKAKTLLYSLVTSVIQSVRIEKEEGVKALSLLEEQLRLAKEEAIQLSLKESDYNRLTREWDTNQKLYDLVMTRLKEASLTGLLQTNNLHVVDYGVVSEIPVAPKKKLIVMATAFFAFLLAMIVATFFELADNTIKGVDDIEKRIGVNLIGILPLVNLEESKRPKDGRRESDVDQYVIHMPKSSFSEAARTIRTNIGFMIREPGAMKLLISSAMPSEGKTTVVSNLAILMANAGRKVVVIDCDMRKPRIHKVFKIPKGKVGLSTLLVEQSSVEESAVNGPVENLHVIPCGPTPPNPSELLQMEQFDRLVERLCEIYDVLLFDSPPVIAVSDALVISRLVHGIIMVAKAGWTSRGALGQAVKVFTDADRPMLGVVMNSLDLSSKKYGYQYYHYYYYRYGYYAYGRKKKRSKDGKGYVYGYDEGGYYGEDDDEPRPTAEMESPDMTGTNGA